MANSQIIVLLVLMEGMPIPSVSTAGEEEADIHRYLGNMTLK
jgi:hypothetical protein